MQGEIEALKGQGLALAERFDSSQRAYQKEINVLKANMERQKVQFRLKLETMRKSVAGGMEMDMMSTRSGVPPVSSLGSHHGLAKTVSEPVQISRAPSTMTNTTNHSHHHLDVKRAIPEGEEDGGEENYDQDQGQDQDLDSQSSPDRPSSGAMAASRAGDFSDVPDPEGTTLRRRQRREARLLQVSWNESTSTNTPRSTPTPKSTPRSTLTRTLTRTPTPTPTP